MTRDPGTRLLKRKSAYLGPAVLAGLCLLVHWQSFTAWFRADDFAWLGVGLHVQDFHDLMRALFSPQAQGTIRPWSERAFFMAGFSLFGLDALPFRVVVFATQFVNLWLVMALGERLSGSRAAGFCAALLWMVHGSMVEPLGWTCVYNQVLCALFLLGALRFLVRYTETGRRRYLVAQWAAFLVGFGALELNAVYPLLAAGYTWLCARKYFRGTLPLFIPSLAYVVLHHAVAPFARSGDYAMHFTGSMLRTAGTYWTWSVGPVFLWSPFVLPSWVLPAGVALLTAGLALFLAGKLRGGGAQAALFGPLWYAVTLLPVLPLRDHVTEYYVYLPLIGICWLAGWALVESWKSRGAVRWVAVALALVYAAMAVPQVVAASQWNHRIAARVRNLVEGVAGAHELHPDKSILLEGVDTDLFWNGVLDRPFRLIGADRVYLAPGSEQAIATHSDLGEIGDYILPADVTAQALERDEVVVYDVRGSRLRNITSLYAQRPLDRKLPLRVDAGSPLEGYLMGPEWYAVDTDHRWMPRRATLRMGAPPAAGMKLYLHGQCPTALLRGGPLGVTLTVDGMALPAASIHPGESAFELAFALPADVVGRPEMQIAVEVSRTFIPPGDPRQLGLAFGVFEVR
jgi:hypothetical protein